MSLGEFCLCLWVFLFLFSSLNPFWDSIFVHPSIQLITAETRSAISPSRWRHPLWFCPMLLCLWAIFCFPSCSRRTACQCWDCAFFPPARGPASETQIRKDGTFFKKGVCAILAVPFPIADFLCFDNSRVRTQIVKWVEGEGSS